ncbi:MAG: cation-transporting P-type ATPase [Candidatus Thiodiazotropha taylori]|nr:cation-transporting P-type ATPase [Candidatus Thiodiazotropha endolucinida]MCW4230976.1 cation-transporting P-type ATPase [Candidatus Thiodiazotropha taylori]
MKPSPNESKPMSWHSETFESCLNRLNTSKEGLPAEEATERLERYGPNRLEPPKRRGPLMRFILQFHNVLVYVLMSAAVMTGVLGMWVDTGVIIGVVVINAIVGFLQEGKAERALEAVANMLSPTAAVVRNNQRDTIAAEDLVPGDIVLLEAGDKVPADIRLIESTRLQIDEAMLTGESVPASKVTATVAANAVLADRKNMAYSGTFVTGGQTVGVVVATGRDTELGRINAMLTEVQTLVTPLTRQLDQFGRWLTVAILLLAAFTFAFGALTPDVPGHSLVELFMATVGLAVAAIPEGLPAIVTITLAIGVQRMARRNAIIRRLPAVETLGAISTICSDKTGTLTRNEMMVQAVVTAQGTVNVAGTGYAPEGELRWADGSKAKQREIAHLAEAAVLCSDAEIKQTDGLWRTEGDPTEGALVTLAARAGLVSTATRSAHPRQSTIPFDSAYRYMATRHSDGSDAFVAIKGAPEALLPRCSDLHDGRSSRSVDETFWQAQVDSLASKGMRTLAVAIKKMPPTDAPLEHEDVADGLTLLGVVGIIDPPRDEAIEAVGNCHSAGIRVKMITGDHALTARAIAAQIGIGNGHDVLTGMQLDGMNDDDLEKVVSDVDVYARTSPEQKLRIVTALQSRGELVAMTGDGVNDAPALKRADVGTAMGIKGTEVAKQSSEMVLADDNFVSIAQAVKEGRTVYQNLRKSIQFILPTNGAQAGVIIAAILFGLTLPITPVQILWINMVTAVTLALTLAFEPAERDIMKRPPRNASSPILDGFLLWRIALVSSVLIVGTVGVFLWELARGEALEASRTAAVNALVMGQIFYLLSVRQNLRAAWSRDALGSNPWIFGAIASVLALQLLFTYWGPMTTLFGTAPTDGLAWAWALMVGFLVFGAVESEKLWRRRGSEHRVKSTSGLTKKSPSH